MKPSDPRLFHCFPSNYGVLGKDSDSGSELNIHNARCDAVGLEILRSTLSDGLLLTPETVPVARLPGSEQENASPAEVQQSRACFTLSTLDNLSKPNQFLGYSHLEVFGNWGFGLDPIASRDFEMCPVTYFYGPDPAQRNYPLISANVHALLEVRELLCQLTLLEAKQDLFDNPDSSRYREVQPFFQEAGVELRFQPSERYSMLRRRREALSADQIRPVLECLHTDKRPLWELVEGIDLISGLFQTADSSSLGASMYYYSQMEWRITKSLSPTFLGAPLFGDLELKNERLRDLVDDAHNNKIASVLEVCGIHGEPMRLELEQCYLVIGSILTKRRFRDYVDVILCPKLKVSEVQTVVAQISNHLSGKVVGV